MAAVLRILAWVFAAAGLIAAAIIYPEAAPPPSALDTLLGRAAAVGRDHAQVVLAWQVGVSGIVAGLFTGALGAILETLQAILALQPEIPGLLNQQDSFQWKDYAIGSESVSGGGYHALFAKAGDPLMPVIEKGSILLFPSRKAALEAADGAIRASRSQQS